MVQVQFKFLRLKNSKILQKKGTQSFLSKLQDDLHRVVYETSGALITSS